MQLFYIPDLDNDIVQLSPDESRHCVRSLRMSAGDTLYITDGKGTLASASILSPDPSACSIQISHRDFQPRRAPYRLHLAIAPTKNSDRIEWFVEKAVEIGIDEITPIITHNTERTRLNRSRLEKIAVSAMKQSLQRHLPVIHDETPIDSFLRNISATSKIICHGHYDRPILMSQACRPSNDTVILIGPEGDFTDDEISLAHQLGFQPVSLGNNRLRTETAALTAVCAVALINQQQQ